MNTRRFLELDALRGLAALAVVIFHFTNTSARLGEPLFDFSIGARGVQLFFCISGFVIYWTLSRCHTLSDFAVSRFSRLYPAYWAAILIYCLMKFGPFEPWPWHQVGVNATMLQAFAGVRHLDVVYWTLGVELTFYFWMAIVFWTRQLHRIVPISIAWLSIAAGCGIAARHTYLPSGTEVVTIFPHIAYFVAGIMFYLIWEEGSKRTYWLVIAAACATIGIMKGSVFDIAVPAAISGIFALAVAGRLRWAVNPITLWLGTISYSLYLTHHPVGRRLLAALLAAGANKYAAVLAAFAGALFVASMVTRFVERPALKFVRERYSRLRRAPTLESRQYR